ncbi:carboxymuconolactone decarboxylase family protein [Kibdelosporangium philippinense]|uniref:Carboxymuconolactone decarboxylase family protein n=1 Tax=Kibdelosporangium philippinense TaxID=211113 RepID=A0ABS8ZQY5_9PSEU|nr:carboxymuconolactone decarboxylase family protein [Kibdelosporangium philippinense]MCE7010170.1 carboxymuconolactone decarboxylase family protein [Kibdelosporangium philippinense]
MGARTRLPDPDPADVPADVQEFLAQLPADPMVKMLTHAVTTVEGFIRQAQALFTTTLLPARSRELLILTVAVVTNCPFVTAQHGPIAGGPESRTRCGTSSRGRTSTALTLR